MSGIQWAFAVLHLVSCFLCSFIFLLFLKMILNWFPSYLILECYWIRHWTLSIDSSCFIFFPFQVFLFLFFILGNSLDFVFQTFHWSFNFGNISKRLSLLFDCSSFVAFCFCSIYSTSPNEKTNLLISHCKWSTSNKFCYTWRTSITFGWLYLQIWMHN